METKFYLSWQRVLGIFFFIALILGGAGLISSRESLARKICKTSWMPISIKKITKFIIKPDALIIFVHGTFGSTMSLLDLPTVNNDKVEGSKYKLIIDMMRNNRIFWRDQAVLSRGLILIDSYASPRNSDEQKSGAHTILHAFSEIDKVTNKNRNLKTYTFGWSGLLSQQRRRREAIRFYNQICEELERLEKEEGIFEPEIEIIAHSHGGNIALNLAGVYHILHNNIKDLIDENHPTEKEFAAQMFRLRDKNDPERFLDGQHRLEYIPTKKDLKINKLVMIGTPVQPKTYALAASDMFEQVFNIYSDEDGVQKMDYVSCCSDTENRKFKLKEELCRKNVFQVRISVCSDQVLKGANKKNEAQDKKMAWWQVFMGMKDISRNSWDPTHKELWFLVKDMEQDEPEVLKPLPVVAVASLIITAINESGIQSQDLDIDLSVQGNKLLVFASEHGSGNFRIIKSMSKRIIRELAENSKNSMSSESDTAEMKLFVQQLMDKWKTMQETH